MSKRKPTSSQPGIDRYFCKSRRTESQVDEGEKTASDSDRQTPAIPTTSNLAARVDENGKTAGDVGDRQTPEIPTTSNSAARVDESEKTADNSDRQTPTIPTTSNSAACVDEEDKTAESTNIHPLLSHVQCEVLIKEFFTQEVAEIKYFQHRSEGSLTEIFLTIGNVVKELTLKNVRAASCFGLMTDEMTDVSVTSQLITFVQYFCTQSETVETSFLSAQNVLKEHDAATAQAIYDLLKEELLSSQLGIKKFDGAGNRWRICHATKQHLNRIVEDDIPMDKLQADVDSFTNLGCDITFPPTSYQQMQSLTQKYVAALSNNLDQRFVSSSDVISALSIFDPVNVPAYEADGFQEYGHCSVNILAKHFFQIETEEVQKLKSEKPLAEWPYMKCHVNDNIKKMIPIEVKEGCQCSKERKTRLRSKLQNDMLQAILAVGKNGPGVQSCLPVVKEAASVWLEAKERRKLPKVPKSDNPTSEPSLVIVQCETKEMGVQCEREETIAVQSCTAADREHEENVNEEDLDEVLEALNLQSKGSESDTDCDSDYAFGSDNDDLAF
ncbi:hypothetical protein AWC38_SpisGene13242 [Stylophora pistillata]|uniref:DUF4371 domain-containing protein n=1 Tax=Stylophora pistillata TaxID=50429 RepID=A0A2B4RZM1_STYPI|nr:hypothetical protein AWC38_SpisGene13242 [Stylophora pistillata]